MTVPGWWNQRRYGLFTQASIATVPSFSALGEDAGWYWSHLGFEPSSPPPPDVDPHPSPMAETLDHHRDRWPHVARYDDFIPFLTFHRFDADEQVDLARDAGMKYLVHVAKHHDGFLWWDAAGAGRTSVRCGPRRNVTGEVAAACLRGDVVFGTYYSLRDWSLRDWSLRDGSLRDGAVGEVVPGHVLDLVERFGTRILWGGRHAGDPSPAPRNIELIERAREVAVAHGLDLVVNDGWGGPDPDVRTSDLDIPAGIDLRPWELRRSLGSSFSHNRAERSEHLLPAGGLFDLLTEVLAKGGNLLVGVGLGVDGTIAEMCKRPLRDVGRWVAAHPDVVHRSRPFDQWGDAQVRYVVVGDDLVALDLAAAGEVVLTGLTPDRYEVVSIETDDGAALHWEQHRGGVNIKRIDRSPAGLAGVYRITWRPATEAIRLFEERLAVPEPLQHLLDAAASGDVVQLREGHYEGPVAVPAGVILRGLGWDRTTVVTGPNVGAAFAAGSAHATVGAGARIENMHLADPGHRAAGRPAAATVLDGAGATLVGCRCDGRIMVDGDDATIVSTIGSSIVGAGERTTIERCALKGTHDDVGIELVGGAGHLLRHNEVVGHLTGIHLRDVSASTVIENSFDARWWAVRLQRCDHIEVVDNDVQHTMRAIDVDGGNGSSVIGNRVTDGDSGAVVQSGATDTVVAGNRVERCRIGFLIWDAPTTQVGQNTFVDLHEEEPVVNGPDRDDG